MGSRRHMFTTFALFLLLQRYGLPARQTALLLLINNLLGMILFRYLGELVARFGERWTLTANFLLLIRTSGTAGGQAAHHFLTKAPAWAIFVS